MIKKILVYRGKHGDEYFDASTKELEESAYRKLFKLLDGNGYYSSEYSTDALARFDSQIDDAQTTVDQLSKLEQTDDIKKLLQTSESKLNRYKRYKKIVETESNDYNQIKNNVDSVDIKIIRRFLYSRNNYEYESFDFQKVL